MLAYVFVQYLLFWQTCLSNEKISYNDVHQYQLFRFVPVPICSCTSRDFWKKTVDMTAISPEISWYHTCRVQIWIRYLLHLLYCHQPWIKYGDSISSVLRCRSWAIKVCALKLYLHVLYLIISLIVYPYLTTLIIQCAMTVVHHNYDFKLYQHLLSYSLFSFYHILYFSPIYTDSNCSITCWTTRHGLLLLLIKECTNISYCCNKIDKSWFLQNIS